METGLSQATTVQGNPMLGGMNVENPEPYLQSVLGLVFGLTFENYDWTTRQIRHLEKSPLTVRPHTHPLCFPSQPDFSIHTRPNATSPPKGLQRVYQLHACETYTI